MARFNLGGLSNLTQAESLGDKDNAALAKQQSTFLKNSDRSFSWEQVAKYSGMALMAMITGISAGAAVAPAATGAAAAGTTTAGILGVGVGALAAIAVLAVVSIGASYIAYKIRANNSLNANEINASSTGREIAAELRKEPIEVSVATPEFSRGNSLPIQFHDEVSDNLLLAQAANDETHDKPSMQIATADAKLLSRISHELEPLSTSR